MKSIGPVIDKTEAFIISEIFHKSDTSLVYIGKDDREIINIKNKLTWLFPNQLILLYTKLGIKFHMIIFHPLKTFKHLD